MQKRHIAILGREREIAVATSVVQSGGSIDVVGTWGSGRTAFLDALCDRLTQSGWTTLRLSGVASLRQHPMAALQFPGLLPNPDMRPSIGGAAQVLHEALRDERSVIVVDDWDDLDEASWGVIKGVRHALDVPIVISRLQGRTARRTPSGLDASASDSALVIEMTPLRFEELESVAEQVLGGPVEMGTMSRLFAKSGGVVGLMMSVLSAAVRDGRVRLVGGLWVATQDLWSPALRGVVEAQLESLTDDARDALEMIALIGSADVDTVRKLVEWSTLELLERRTLIQLIPSGSRRLVTVVPPLLVEYYRHEPVAVRRIRLTQAISEKLDPATREEVLINVSSTPREAPEHDALFARLVQERLRTRRLVSGAEWRVSRDTDTVQDYVWSLMYTGAPESEIQSVLDQTDPASGSLLSQTQFVALRARWTAYVRHDLPSALRMLEDASETAAEYAPILTAAAIGLRCTLGSITEDDVETLKADDSMPSVARAALRDCQIQVLVILGRFGDARRVYREYNLDVSAALHMPATTHAHYALALFGQGEHEAGMAITTRGVQEAHSFLDIEAARAIAAAAAVGYALAGDYEPIDDLLGALLVAGELPFFPAGPYRTLLTLASTIAARRGNIPLAERYLRELDSHFRVDGLLPAQARDWPAAQLLASAGDIDAAADLLWNSGTALWARGGRSSALLILLNAAELGPSRERLEHVARLVEQVPERLFTAQYDYLRARCEGDPDRLAAAVPELVATGRPGTALTALRRAAAIRRESGENDVAEAIDVQIAALLAALPRKSIDASRFASSAITLSAREVEVAQLVAEGLTNPEIARRLVLSIRTVESHVHRIIRKLDLPNRQALREYIESRSTS